MPLRTSRAEATLQFRGISIDIPPESLPDDQWSNGQNVYFDANDLSTKRIGGHDAYSSSGFPSGFKPLHVQVVRAPTVVYWLVVGDTATTPKIYVTDGTTWTDITPAGGLTAVTAGEITSCVINGFPIVNLANGTDVPYEWDLQTSNAMTSLTGWDANWRCKAIRSFRYHLFAINMTETSVEMPHKIRWSDAAQPNSTPNSWTAGGSSDAGSVELSATIGHCVDAIPLRDSLLIAKEKSMYLATYVGGTFIFNFRKLFLEDGVNGRNQMAEVEGTVFFFSGEDFMATDGQSARKLAIEKVRDYMVGAINSDQAQLVCIANRHFKDEIWIAIPEVNETDLTLAFIYNIRSGDWGMRDLPNVMHINSGLIGDESAGSTWADYTDPWEDQLGKWNEALYSSTADELMMAGYASNAIWVVDRIETFNGTDVEAYVTRESFPFGDMQRIKQISEVWPHIVAESDQQFVIKVGAQEYYGDDIGWRPSQTFTLSDTPQKIDVDCVGRYFSFHISTTGGKPWRIYGLKVTYRERGKYL